MNEKPKVRTRDILTQEVKDEILIYDLSINKAFSLNETTAMVWNECNDTKTIAEISNILSRKTKTLISEEVVWLALETLQKENLLADNEEIASTFNGLSRRDVIRKVGFASMIALPIVTSLIAPTAANAQSVGSCITLNQFACTTSATIQQSNCCSNLRCAFDGKCINCIASNSQLTGLVNISSASQCDTSCNLTNRGLCCDNTSPMITNYNASNRFCTCICP